MVVSSFLLYSTWGRLYLSWEIHFACWNTLWMHYPFPPNRLLWLSPLHSHCAETCHGGSKLVKEEPARERQEIVHKGGDGENQRELFILSAAVCGYVIRKKKEKHCQGNRYNFISFKSSFQIFLTRSKRAGTCGQWKWGHDTDLAVAKH